MEDFVGHRECGMQHEALTDRLDKIEHRQVEIERKQDEGFTKIFERLDALSVWKGKVEFTDQKVETLGKKLDKHVDQHTDFIKWTLAILALSATLITIVTFLLTKGGIKAIGG
jgi:hypothetical protein